MSKQKNKINLSLQREKVKPTLQVQGDDGYVKEQKCHLSFQLSNELLKEFKLWSIKMGTDLSEFLRGVILRALDGEIKLPVEKANIEKDLKITRGFYLEKSKYNEFRMWLVKNDVKYVDLFIQEIRKVIK